MEAPRIEVVISPEGVVTIHVQGVQGLSCVDLTADLVAALGGQVTDQEWTLEAHQTPEPFAYKIWQEKNDA